MFRLSPSRTAHALAHMSICGSEARTDVSTYAAAVRRTSRLLRRLPINASLIVSTTLPVHASTRHFCQGAGRRYGLGWFGEGHLLMKPKMPVLNSRG